MGRYTAGMSCFDYGAYSSGIYPIWALVATEVEVRAEFGYEAEGIGEHGG